ncbi:MAG: OsmC family protein, partial [Pseudomonadales bacterium]|nr:OsmC family protein [Pseudomonadales bacterium]
MDAFPHHYRVRASGSADADVRIDSDDLPSLATQAPVEFGGPGGRWSPETLLVAAVADCYVLSFRAVAAASKLSFEQLDCEVEGVLDRVERTTRFTAFEIRARLQLPTGGDEDKAMRLMEKAEAVCLISNSLT